MMNSVGDWGALASVGQLAIAFFVAILTVRGLTDYRIPSQSRGGTVRLASALRLTFVVGLVVVGIWMTVRLDFDFVFPFFTYLSWVALGSLAGRVFSSWARESLNANVSDRRRRADWISTWIWLVSAGTLAVSLLIYCSTFFSGVIILLLILFCWFCGLIGFLPHHLKIRKEAAISD
jgi:hypothetical protein